MKYNVFVVGGSGFIGTRLCKDLEKTKRKFKILDLKISKSFPDKTLIGDIRWPKKIGACVSAEALVHLAAVHRDDVGDQSAYYDTNVVGTQNICSFAEANEIEKIIFTSSVAVYGNATPDADEKAICNPINDYGRTKLEAENVLKSWQARDPSRRTLVIVRPTVVFGEGNRGNVFNLINQIVSKKFIMIGAGKNKKSMAYVGNLSNFLIYCLGKPSGIHILNYVDGPNLSMNQFVQFVRRSVFGKDSVGARLPYWFGMLVGFGFDRLSDLTGRKYTISMLRVRKFTEQTTFSSQAHLEPGFKAQCDLEDAIMRTLNYDFINPLPDREEFFTE